MGTGYTPELQLYDTYINITYLDGSHRRALLVVELRQLP